MKSQKRTPTPAANPVAPVFTVSLPLLSELPIPLSFQHADFAEAEYRLGKPLLGLPAAEFWAKSAQAYQTKVLLFVGLMHLYPDLQFDDLRKHVTFKNAAEIEAVVAEAFAAALPEILGDEKEADTPGDGEAPFEAGSNGGSIDGASDASTSG
jgi:hypothetical protein